MSLDAGFVNLQVLNFLEGVARRSHAMNTIEAVKVVLP
jgi:hypothetical protein